MERLQKKCIFVSAGVHVALVLVLVFGPAFRSAPERPKRVTQINLLSAVAIEAALQQAEQSAAEREKVTPPVVEPAPEPPPRQTPKPKQPEPVVEQPKPEPIKKVDPPKPIKEQAKPKPTPKIEEKPKPVAKKTPPKPKPKPDIKINFNATAQKPDTLQKQEAQRRAVEEQRRRERAAAQKRREMQQSLESLGNSLSEKSKLQADLIGGSALGNYRVHVKVAYDRAWVEPAGAGSARGVARVQVTVNTDGSIASAKIIGYSGNQGLDQSVQDALRRVKRIERRPPSGTSVADRTFIINFNLKDGLIAE